MQQKSGILAEFYPVFWQKAHKKAQAEADKAAKRAEQEKAINDAKESLNNLKGVLTK